MLKIRHLNRLGVILLVATFVTACTAPGTPVLRTSSLDSEGALIPGCKNVSKRIRVDQYITEFYLSTYGSAWLEGTMAGFRQGVSEGLRDTVRTGGLLSGMNPPDANRPNALPFSLEPFCMGFRSPAPAVSHAVASILPRLGNRILLSDEANGVFETDFVERHHRAARWRDKFVISVEEVSGQTVVKVLRILYISRGGPFNQAISVGHNESWVLTQVNTNDRTVCDRKERCVSGDT